MPYIPDPCRFPILTLAQREGKFKYIKDAYAVHNHLVAAACPHNTPETVAAAICAMRLPRAAWIEVQEHSNNFALLARPTMEGTITVHRVETNGLELHYWDPQIVLYANHPSPVPNWEAVAAGVCLSDENGLSGWDCVRSRVFFSDKDVRVDDNPVLYLQGVKDLVTVAIVTSPLMLGGNY